MRRAVLWIITYQPKRILSVNPYSPHFLSSVEKNWVEDISWRSAQVYFSFISLILRILYLNFLFLLVCPIAEELDAGFLYPTISSNPWTQLCEHCKNSATQLLQCMTNFDSPHTRYLTNTHQEYVWAKKAIYSRKRI